MLVIPIRSAAAACRSLPALVAAILLSSTAHAQGNGGVQPEDEVPYRMRPSGEIGLMFGLVPGAAGELRNPGLQITPGLALAVGGRVRYHLSFAYSHLTGVGPGVDGIDLRPLTLGFPVPIKSPDPEVGLAIEPLVDLVGMHAYFGNGAAAFLFSSGFGVQAVVSFKSGFLAIAPLNFQFQYAGVATGHGNTLSGGGFGLNMPVRLAGGLRF